MRKIRLENFRCYADQTIEFKPGINLLVGDNGSGKTSIIKACRYVLSSFFAGFSDENTVWESFKNDDFRVESYSGEIRPSKSITISFANRKLFRGSQINFPSNMGALSKKVWREGADEQYLTKTSKKNSRIPISGIRIFKQQSSELLKTYFNDDKRFLPLPLFAYFPAKDYENNNANDKKRFKNYYHIPSFGYYECLASSNNFKNWVNRLVILEEGQKNTQDINIVKCAIESALGLDGCNIINSIDIRKNQGVVYFILTDGREIAAENLSDGFKRIANIVIDIAFRCVHLNRTMYGYDTCKETNGTVLIDEIDLHLHPTLQSTILKGLRNAFPNLQFIVTTHAPMVMSSVESNDENVVYKLDYSNDEGYSVNEVVTYGMDLSTISEIVLEQPARDGRADRDLTKLFNLIDDNNDDEAIAMVKELRKRYSNIPDLSRAESMLNCREVVYEEDK